MTYVYELLAVMLALAWLFIFFVGLHVATESDKAAKLSIVFGLIGIGIAIYLRLAIGVVEIPYELNLIEVILLFYLFLGSSFGLGYFGGKLYRYLLLSGWIV